jgi:protocatechuate 3,4-dioxygenase beta subunit
MKNSVSKSVLGIVLTGILFTAAIAWFGLRSHKNAAATPEAAPVTETKTAPAKPTTTAKPAAEPAKVAAVRSASENISLAVIPISLTNIIDDAESAWFRNDTGMKTLPADAQVYGGIEFWLQGAIHLQGLATRDDQHKKFRTNITVPLDETNFADGKISVSERGKNIACIYLLAGTRYSTQTGEKFADVLWHYADGTASRSELRYNVHLRDWWRSPYEDPARLPNELTKVAWQGLHPARKTGSIRLYRVAFINPHPEKTIHSLEFASALARPSLFVAALTLDPLMPGARSDNLTSDEMPDPEMKNHLQLLVMDNEGHPLPNSKIAVITHSKENSYLNRKFTTDDTGSAQVGYPDTGLETLDVSAEHDGFSGRKMLWDVSGGDSVPGSYTLKLGAEVKIGGIVVNEEGNPVPDAEIRLYRFWRGSDDGPDKKGEQAAFSSQTQKTDDQGRWQAGGLPATLMGNIGFEIKHPDYMSASDNIGDNSTSEKQLRDGTYKTVLKHGLMVRGRVVDGSGNPVAAAAVAFGRRYFSDRQQTSSDAEGKFSFNNIKDGEGLFSVTAKGYAAASKTIVVSPETPEIIFQLKPGNSLHGHVQDESGLPVANAQVGLENNGMDSAENAYDFSANTDNNGDFTWDGAPNDTLTLYVFRDGFEAKRDAKVSSSQDNIITLRHSRTLQGFVLDADTEQPVTKFTIRTGKASDSGEDVYGIIRYKSFTAADGKFSMPMEEEEDNAVLVMADGYSDKVEKFPDSTDKTIQVVARLKPAASLSGVVLAPDGSPAPGVTVATGSDSGVRHYVQLSGGRLRSYDSQTKVATTDDQGRFKLGSTPDDGIVVAAGELGFARAPLAEVKSSATITLQPWGRIEGTLHSGGQPAAGKDLLFNLDIPGIGTDFNGFKSTTDDHGKFTMEQIPPGDGKIVRLIQTTKNSWSHSDAKDVTVKPGETTQVTLGDDGALVTGRYRYSFQPTNEAPLQLEGSLSLQVDMPPVPKFNSPAEAQAFFKTPEWQAAQKRQKYYTAELKPDGTFTAENVIPGTYILNIFARVGGNQAWRNPPVAQGNTQFTVPDSFTPSQPVDAGEVQLNPPPQSNATLPN